MRLVNFGEVLEIKNGRNQKRVENPSGRYPIYGSGGIMGYADEYLCDAETIVLGRKGSINTPIFVEQPFWNVDTAFGLCANKDYLYPKYLYYFCQQFDFERLNTTVTIPSLTKTNLLEVKLPLPPLAEQRRIAGILDKADAIRRKRQQSLKLTDDLVKSQFIEMFGDPVANPKKWHLVTIGPLIENIVAGESLNGEARLLNEGEKGVLKVSAVTYGYFDPDEYKVISEPQEIKKYIYPRKGDLLFSRANTKELVGATAIIKQDYPDLLLPDKLWRITFCQNLDAHFVKYVLSSESIRLEMSKQATGTSGSMFNISMEKLKKIHIPLPPLALQTQFAAFVEQADKSKFTMQNQLSEIEILSSALKQKFFA